MIESSFNKTTHYCQACKSYFKVAAVEEDGDYFLECPVCKKLHYRYFEFGVATHCDLTKRKHDPVLIKQQ